MRKTIWLFAVIILLLMLLLACNSNDGNKTPETSITWDGYTEEFELQKTTKALLPSFKKGIAIIEKNTGGIR